MYKEFLKIQTKKVPIYIKDCLKHNCYEEMQTISAYNFALKSKLIRPQFIMALAISLAHNNDLEQFKMTKDYDQIFRWCCAVEMMHNASLYHVS